MPVGLTIAVKGETLINIATSKMDEASKPQSDLREGLAHMKPTKMRQVNDQNTLDSFFQW